MVEEKKFNIKAVIIGLLVDTIGSFIAGFFISFIAGMLFMSQGITQDQITQQLLHSKTFMNVLVFTGFSLTFLGGYVTAYIAGADELKHTAVMGILSLIISLLFTVGQTTEQVWYLISLFVIPFALLGGYLRKITKKT
jgi:cation transport ATPase